MQFNFTVIFALGRRLNDNIDRRPQRPPLRCVASSPSTASILPLFLAREYVRNIQRDKDNVALLTPIVRTIDTSASFSPSYDCTCLIIRYSFLAVYDVSE